MAGMYTPQQLNIQAPSGGFQQGGWYNGRQYWGGQFSDAGVINPLSNQQGAGQAVSHEVNAQSAAAQHVAPQQLENYIQKQNQQPVQANAPVPAPASTPDMSTATGNQASAGAGTGGIGIAPPATIDLQGIYNGLTKSAGISDKETQLTKATQDFNDAQSKINDNPFLSESNRVGRIQKLQNDYNNNVKGLQDSITMAKQDVQTQLDLQTKQFDINSQAAQQSFSQFNTLLSSGALDNASGSDIASITAATGMSSTMIQSAINATKAKDSAASTQVIQFNDGTNTGYAVINSKTGEIINKQVIAGAPPTKYNTGDTTGDNPPTPVGNSKNITQQFYSDAATLKGKVINGQYWGQFPQLVMQYAPSMSLQDIYKAYANSPLGKKYGAPGENATQIQQLYNYVKTGKK